MKEQLIKLAKDKGFKSKVMILPLTIEFKESEYTSVLKQRHEDLVYYLSLCELKQWLTDEYKIQIINGHGLWDKKYSFKVLISDGFNMHPETKAKLGIETPELALELAIFEALKLI